MAQDIISRPCCSVGKSCLTLCCPMDCSTPGLPVHHQLPEFTQTHVLITGGQGQTVSLRAEQRHFSLQSSRGAGSSRQAIECDYNNKSKSKKVSHMKSELASSLQQLLTSALVVACRVFHCCMGTLSCGPWDLVP